MDGKEVRAAPDRRDFLKMVAVSGPAAAVAVAAGSEASAGSAETLVSTTLKDTEHTRAYYESARF
ncbi:MAG: twin-arginine translocation signal domain-containing protein [Rhodobacteraceae bacterium]|nr:twin-arginine translocation signal domain-containing protein [Paracoccaceae bacterium]